MTRFSANTLSRRILGGSAVSIGVRVAGVALSYGVNILLSRFLGLAGYGAYVVALGWALVLVLPARLGFDYSALRYGTAYLEADDRPALRGFVQVSLASVLGLSLVIGAAMIGVAAIWSGRAGLPIVVAAALLIGPLAILGILSVLMRVAGKLFDSQFYDQVLRPAVLLLLLALWIAAGGPRVPSGAMVLTTAAAFLALAALGLRFRKSFARVWTARPRFTDARGWFALSLPLLGVTVAQELLNQVEIILLGVMAGPQAAGLFAAAARLVSLMAFALAAFGIVSGPLIASAHHRRDDSELQHITTLTTRLGLLFAAAVAIMLVVGGRLLLALFGPEFQPAYGPLLILVAGALVNAFTGIVVYLATLTGRERPALVIFLLALGLSLALNLVLIPRLGVVGAAIASSVALSFWNLGMLLYVRRSLGIDASAIGRPVNRHE